MKDAAFKRVKHRHEPGDVSKQEKIAMREKSVRKRRKTRPTVSEHAAKSYRKTINQRTRAVNKRRTRATIKAGMES